MSTKRIRTAVVISLAGLFAGCGGTTKFSGSAVALNVTSDGSVSGAVIEQLAITVAGADTTSFSVPASAGLGTGEAQTLVYNATAASGTLDFTVAAMAHGIPAAMGAGSVDVKAGRTAALTITLSAAPPPDLATEPADMAMPLDMAMPPADMTGVVVFDLLGVDLAHGPIVPSNTTVAYDPAAADLAGVVGIDTTGLQIAIAGGPGNDGGVLAAPPTGVGFVVNGSFAVMTVGKWTVDKEVRVTGTRGLIVIAKSVDIKNLIHAEAAGGTAGPGGAGAAAGAGKGGNGGSGSFCVPTCFPTFGGGGGAGHGTVGGVGGSSIGAAPGGAGPTYNLTLTDLSGGSGGGTGAGCGLGGAGGGALQISANESINVELGGVVNAGGGGAQAATCSGAGSGGTLLFEARAITVRGVLSANGGSFTGDAVVGRGSNASFGSGATVDNGASNGSFGFPHGLGGGGGAGRITLRTSGPYAADVLAASAISPAPTIDTSVP